MTCQPDQPSLKDQRMWCIPINACADKRESRKKENSPPPAVLAYRIVTCSVPPPIRYTTRSPGCNGGTRQFMQHCRQQKSTQNLSFRWGDDAQVLDDGLRVANAGTVEDGAPSTSKGTRPLQTAGVQGTGFLLEKHQQEPSLVCSFCVFVFVPSRSPCVLSGGHPSKDVGTNQSTDRDEQAAFARVGRTATNEPPQDWICRKHASLGLGLSHCLPNDSLYVNKDRCSTVDLAMSKKVCLKFSPCARAHNNKTKQSIGPLCR
jgi:hypothetical protein